MPVNSFNDPLLYIKGPPVFHLPPSIQAVVSEEVGSIEEESTSIYEMKKVVQEDNSNDSSPLMEQLRFLSLPFQKKVYRPLMFHLEDGLMIQGEVERIDQRHVTIKTKAGEVLVFPVGEIKKITWRGGILK